MTDEKHPNGWPGASDRGETESHRHPVRYFTIRDSKMVECRRDDLSETEAKIQEMNAELTSMVMEMQWLGQQRHDSDTHHLCISCKEISKTNTKTIAGQLFCNKHRGKDDDLEGILDRPVDLAMARAERAFEHLPCHIIVLGNPSHFVGDDLFKRYLQEKTKANPPSPAMMDELTRLAKLGSPSARRALRELGVQKPDGWLPEALQDALTPHAKWICLCGQPFVTENGFAAHLPTCPTVQPA